MSTTQKVLEKLYEILNEKVEGVTTTELWDYLLQDEELKKFLYLGDTRRDGVVAGLTTRIKNGNKSTDGIRIVQNSEGKNVFLLDDNNFSFIHGITNKYLRNVNAVSLEAKNYKATKKEKVLITKFEKALENSNILNNKLKNYLKK